MVCLWQGLDQCRHPRAIHHFQLCEHGITCAHRRDLPNLSKLQRSYLLGCDPTLLETIEMTYTRNLQRSKVCKDCVGLLPMEYHPTPFSEKTCVYGLSWGKNHCDYYSPCMTSLERQSFFESRLATLSLEPEIRLSSGWGVVL